jgi:hypothetical protein
MYLTCSVCSEIWPLGCIG